MNGALAWAREGADWPHRAASRFVTAGGIQWHVQIMGSGEPLLLLHGTGASTHSWRDLLPVLARHYRVIALDLPGHGFTDAPENRALSLPGMAALIGALLRELKETPSYCAGHSAGAAVLIRMALDGLIAPKCMIGLNAALLPYGGSVGRAFSSIAKLFALNPLVPRFFAWQAGDPDAIRRLIEGTGSRIEPQGLALYQTLFSSRQHVRATISMMANWDLFPLIQQIDRLRPALHLVVAKGDKAVSPEDARQIKRDHPAVQLHWLNSGGHLAHEEDPIGVSALIHELAQSAARAQSSPKRERALEESIQQTQEPEHVFDPIKNKAALSRTG
jgi:magnesium chelatase accessory protein